MTTVGKRLRLRRILDSRDRTVLVPMDHGVSIGPAAGIESPGATVQRLAAGGASAVIVQKGLVPHIAGSLAGTGLLVHISASTDLNPDPNDKRLVGTVEECVRLGADGVSVHVNVGAPTESRMVADLGRVATACEQYGMPLLAMMYPRGHEITNPHDLKLVAHVARLGAELGADIVKCPYTGDPESFRRVVDGCPVPVVISGGPKMGDVEDVLRMVHDTVAAGGAGVSMGRNIWQHANVPGMTRAIHEIVLNDAGVDDALACLKA